MYYMLTAIYKGLLSKITTRVVSSLAPPDEGTATRISGS